ncbi:hypothetical protein Sjap_002577 [Stephania japonica]|uniref:Uncharacterized protein n=1 Tax=Stephania japonica TaxID=461633 RepID=A0AAP0KM47_9MAGN
MWTLSFHSFDRLLLLPFPQLCDCSRRVRAEANAMIEGLVEGHSTVAHRNLDNPRAAPPHDTCVEFSIMVALLAGPSAKEAVRDSIKQSPATFQ